MYIILKLKSEFETITKEIPQVLKIMMLGFILIIAILGIKYKTVYAVKEDGKILGYIQNKKEFNKKINEQIINKEIKNVDNISLLNEPQYDKRRRNNKEIRWRISYNI